VQRQVRIVVPFKFNGAKSRLGSVLTPEERKLLAFTMLRDVLDAITGLGDVTILSRSGLKKKDLGLDVDILESDLELNDALNALIEEQASQGWPFDIFIIMADLALLTKDVVNGILDTEGDVILCPGRGGGTNMILIRSQMFRTRYCGLSFPKNVDFARKAGLKAEIYESFRAATDIDEPDDLVEVLLHGHGKTKSVLESMGFFLSDKGRMCLGRVPDRDI
jgi:2-phospho-L-lactate/phosphoenolpyruvate guanylyltransferase